MAKKTGAVAVRGLRELQRDFKRMQNGLPAELRKELKKAAEPVADTAEMYALGKIRHMPASPEWAEMRVGVTAKAVYVAPSQRGSGRRKSKNWGALMLKRAMDPALEVNREKITDALDDMLGRFGNDYGF